MTIFYDPRCLEYSTPDHPERPERIARTAPSLKDRHPEWDWREPILATDDELARAHSRQHIDRVATSRQDFDADTPWHPNIEIYARDSVGATIEAARTALHGEPAFSLMRPPGHHATRDRAMGFCYFNNVAIAALDALERGAERISIWDFDGHHGNGTEAIVTHNQQIRFASLLVQFIDIGQTSRLRPPRRRLSQMPALSRVNFLRLRLKPGPKKRS